MNIHEQEQRDYESGWATEQQNALAMSRMNRRPDDSEKIAKAIEDHKFVVVCEQMACCPITDAIIGVDRWLEAVYDSYKEAYDAFICIPYEYIDDETNYYIIPRPPAPTPPVRTCRQDDELPF